MNAKKIGILGAVGAAVALLGTVLTATPANAQELGVVVRTGPGIQADKNIARNVGIGLGAAAAYELSRGRDRAAFGLGVGAIVAGERYEADRRIEDRGPLVTPVVCEPVRPAHWGATYVAPVRVEYREPVRYERPVVVVDRGRGDFGRDGHAFGHPDRDRHDGWDRH